MNTGKCTHAKGKKKNTRKKEKEKQQTTKKNNPRNPNRLKSVGSLALCFVLPDGGLCSATGVEPEALFPSLLLFSGGALSRTPHPAGNGAALKAAPGPGRAQMCAQLTLNSLGAACSWALLKCEGFVWGLL